VVPDLIALLVGEEQIVELAHPLYLDVEAEADLRRRVTERLADGARVTMAELRDVLGTTRKYSVPIGEYLDRIGLTVREGDTRRLSDQHRAAAHSLSPS
jgi:selenocysteine-specific elongation factor